MDDFETILPKLVKIQLFSDFKIDNEEDKRILKTVYENIKLQSFKAGDVIIKEGERGDSFFILYEGKVQVLRNTIAGDTIALANLSADQNIFFGETALISNDVRSATVKAVTDCKTLVLSGKKFYEMCNKEPVLGFRVIYKLAHRLADTVRKTNTDKTTLYEALLDEVEGDYY